MAGAVSPQSENREEREMTQAVEQKNAKIDAVAKMLQAFRLTFEAQADFSENDEQKFEYRRQAKLAESLLGACPALLEYGIEITFWKASPAVFLRWKNSWDGSLESVLKIEFKDCWASWSLQSNLRKGEALQSVETRINLYHFPNLEMVSFCSQKDGGNLTGMRKPYIGLHARTGSFYVSV